MGEQVPSKELVTLDGIISSLRCIADDFEAKPLGKARCEVVREAISWLDDCRPYLKDGETPTECIERNRRDVDQALNLLIIEKRKNERAAPELRVRKCAANMHSDPPRDCDAPFCGCNPAWDDCIKMLQECDLLIDRRAPRASQPQVDEPAASPLEMARRFHAIYERLAPQYGYKTRSDTREFRAHSDNGRLMIAVCTEIIAAYRLGPPPLQQLCDELATQQEDNQFLRARILALETSAQPPGAGESIAVWIDANDKFQWDFENNGDHPSGAAIVYAPRLAVVGNEPCAAPSTDLADYGYAPGNYTSHCLSCDQYIDFVDKRCRCCRSCAQKKMERAFAVATPTKGGE